MQLVPVILHPSFIIRRNAMRKGLLGSSTLWKVIAVIVFGRSTLKKVFGRTAEPLGVRTLGAGSILMVAASRPLGRREAKRAGISTATIAAAAHADLEAAQRAS